MSRFWYLSHPQVQIDPAVAVTDWALSDLGRSRALALAALWPRLPLRILTSPERKARETAAILAARLALPVEVWPATGEVDRSATGYVPPDRHEALADALFADPARSAEGWETALDAQARLGRAVQAALLGHHGDLLMVGHGAVGSLLWCQIAGRAIDRREDQPGQGHVWQARITSQGLVAERAWLPLERLAAPDAGC